MKRSPPPYRKVTSNLLRATDSSLHREASSYSPGGHEEGSKCSIRDSPKFHPTISANIVRIRKNAGGGRLKSRQPRLELTKYYEGNPVAEEDEEGGGVSGFL